jgi:hypothetical protein
VKEVLEARGCNIIDPTSYRWIKFVGFSESYLEKIEKDWKDMPHLDGFYKEEEMCCFKFDKFKPIDDTTEHLKNAYLFNEDLAEYTMKSLKKTINKLGGFYMNNLTIKKLK